MKESEGKGFIMEGIGKWAGDSCNVWALFYFETVSLSLLFLLLSGLCFNLFCFVMEKWESALKYMGGIGFGMNDTSLFPCF